MPGSLAGERLTLPTATGTGHRQLAVSFSPLLVVATAGAGLMAAAPSRRVQVVAGG